MGDPDRARFEAWVHENMPDMKLTRDHPQSYTLLGVRRMWGAWQEAVRQEREAVLAAILDTWRVRGSVDELSARRCWENAIRARSEQ